MIHVSNCAIYENAISTAFALAEIASYTNDPRSNTWSRPNMMCRGTTPAHRNINKQSFFISCSFILAFHSYQFDNA